MKQEKFNYEEAMEQLEAVVSKMESGEMNITTLATELKKARELLKKCKDKLTKTEEELNAIISEDNN